MRVATRVVTLVLVSTRALAGAPCEQVVATCSAVHVADDRLSGALGQLALAARHPWLTGGAAGEEAEVESAADDLGTALDAYDRARRATKTKCPPCSDLSGARGRLQLWGKKRFGD